MKRILLPVLLLASTVTFAQTYQLGVKGGLNFSNYTGKNFDANTLIGFHVGGLINFKIGEVFSIQPEVMFSSQGAKYKGATQESNLKVSYVTVPVMAKLKFGSIYVEAGPQVNFKTSEDVNVPNQSINKFAKGLDLSLDAGIGYHSKSGFGIGARYVAGISKVGDFNSNSNVNANIKNSVLQVSLFLTLFNNK